MRELSAGVVINGGIKIALGNVDVSIHPIGPEETPVPHGEGGVFIVPRAYVAIAGKCAATGLDPARVLHDALAMFFGDSDLDD